jgi:hypothetical protein
MEDECDEHESDANTQPTATFTSAKPLEVQIEYAKHR